MCDVVLQLILISTVAWHCIPIGACTPVCAFSSRVHSARVQCVQLVLLSHSNHHQPYHDLWRVCHNICDLSWQIPDVNVLLQATHAELQKQESALSSRVIALDAEVESSKASLFKAEKQATDLEQQLASHAETHQATLEALEKQAETLQVRNFRDYCHLLVSKQSAIASAVKYATSSLFVSTIQPSQHIAGHGGYFGHVKRSQF